MARWFYNRPSECCDESEVKVAYKLSRLSKRWTIRWGYYYKDNKGVRREGDFLIFDPLHGLLVLEVKGFRLRGFAPTGKWEGDPGKDKDHPLFQLDQEHAAVLKALTAVEPGWYPVAKALCLPNEVIPEGQKSYQGIPRELIVDGRDLERFDSNFGRFFDGEEQRHIKQHRDVFLQAYGKEGRPKELKHFIDHNEVIFRKQLTRQYHLLDILEGNQQLFIEGGAGTGKTWNAVEKAVRLAEAGDGADVLLLCYNIALGRFLRDLVGRRKLARGSISVFQWEELARHILVACGIENEAPLPDAAAEEKMRYYDQDLPGLLLECVREKEFAERLPRFNALVVSVDLEDSTPSAVLEAVEEIIRNWIDDGYCQPEDILILHARTRLNDSALGSCETLGGLPLVEYGESADEKRCIRHLSINRAKGLDSLAVILLGVLPFQKTRRADGQYTYFMGASRAKQLLGIVHS